LKSVDFPTLGSPTIPSLSITTDSELWRDRKPER